MQMLRCRSTDDASATAAVAAAVVANDVADNDRPSYIRCMPLAAPSYLLL